MPTSSRLTSFGVACLGLGVLILALKPSVSTANIMDGEFEECLMIQTASLKKVMNAQKLSEPETEGTPLHGWNPVHWSGSNVMLCR